MKFGSSMMGVSLRSYPEVAAAFEANGFESLWVPEHLVFPAEMPPSYPYSESGYPPVTSDTPSYDPWVLLSYMASATSTIRLATNIFILPLRHPLQTARSVVTLDRVSGGRVTLGVGVGWLEEEFRYLGVDYRARGRLTDAAISAIRRLWTDDVVEVHDELFDFGPVKFNPKPLQRPSIPIEIGGSSKPALRRAGLIGDGWIEIGSVGFEDFEESLAIVRQGRQESGRTGPFEVTASASLAHDLDGYRRLSEAGATRVITSPPPSPDGRLSAASATEWAKRFADEVISRV